MHARRMASRHKRGKSQPKLNLVSLMDIFTILVFFLLVNSSAVEVLQSDKSIKLPESVADKKPEETLVVMVNEDDIIINGRAVADVSSVLASDADEIAPLRQELEYLAARKPLKTEAEREAGRDITIMGDAQIPYTLLKRIMHTSAQSGYANISLAVTQVSAEKAEPAAGG